MNDDPTLVETEVLIQSLVQDLGNMPYSPLVVQARVTAQELLRRLAP